MQYWEQTQDFVLARKALPFELHAQVSKALAEVSISLCEGYGGLREEWALYFLLRYSYKRNGGQAA